MIAARARRAEETAYTGVLTHMCDAEGSCAERIAFRVAADSSYVDITSTFMDVSPNGWIGIGFSTSNGFSMTDSDAILGWWDNGTPYVRDMAVSSYSGPTVESDQSDLLSSSLKRVGTTATLTVRRKLAGTATSGNKNLGQNFQWLFNLKGDARCVRVKLALGKAGIEGQAVLGVAIETRDGAGHFKLLMTNLPIILVLAAAARGATGRLALVTRTS